MQAANTGIPDAVTSELVAALGTALRGLRTDFRDRPEQVLAAEWRAGFADRVTWLDDTRCYLMITHAMAVVHSTDQLAKLLLG